MASLIGLFNFDCTNESMLSFINIQLPITSGRLLETRWTEGQTDMTTYRAAIAAKIPPSKPCSCNSGNKTILVFHLPPFTSTSL